MRVVVDTNIFVSSFFGGNPRRIIDLWKTCAIMLCLTRAIVEEYIEVLQRLGLKQEKELQELLDLFAKGFNSVFSAKTPVLKIVVADPDDDMFIECAVALKASFIISGDKALLNVKEYMGIKVLSANGLAGNVFPYRFINRIASQHHGNSFTEGTQGLFFMSKMQYCKPLLFIQAKLSL